MPYKAKGKCVYKADTGKKVGCTKGPVSKYLAALHANVPDAKHENLNKEDSMNEATKPVISPEALKKIVQYLAKEAEEFQNYVGVDASYDVMFDTIVDIITDSKNKKLQNFWNGLGDKQQMEVFNMIHQYLLNKEIKKDPEYFGGETVQPINYTLTPKSTGKAPTGSNLDKLVKYLAKKSAEHMDYVGLDSPEQIMFDQFSDVIEMDVKDAKIHKIWNSMNAKQQEKLYNKVVAVLEKKYGYQDDIYEGRNLSKMAKTLMEMNYGLKHGLNPKTRDLPNHPGYASAHSLANATEDMTDAEFANSDLVPSAGQREDTYMDAIDFEQNMDANNFVNHREAAVLFQRAADDDRNTPDAIAKSKQKVSDHKKEFFRLKKSASE